jgi:parallel beta-helix repeat protein
MYARRSFFSSSIKFGCFVILLVASNLFVVAEALVAQTTNGCPPPPAPTGHAWYVDPVHGSMSGDGSSAHPWQTLSGVISANLISSQTRGGGNPTYSTPLKPLNPKGVVQPGDVIYLLSGDHGKVYLNGYVNSSFITVMAAPGNTPVLDLLEINGCSNWAFEGLTIQGLSETLAIFGESGWYGPTDHLYLMGNHLNSQADVSGWTQQDWLTSGSSGVSVRTGVTYVSLINNDIRNVRTGMGVAGSNVLVQGNTIDNFGDDALDYAGSLITIRWNTITNSHTLGDGNHNDCMQGQISFPGGQPDLTPHHDIVIDSNLCITVLDPTLPFLSQAPLGGCQGIDFFDGVWNNFSVVNNVVIFTAYHGISLYGPSNAEITNNTVECIDSDPKVFGWILVTAMKSTETGAAPTNTIVRNNVAPQVNLYATGVSGDHNIVLKAGTATDPAKVFRNFVPGSTSYDMRPLLPSSPLIGAGNTVGAPPLDITGLTRTPPIDVGAYSAGATSTSPGSYVASGGGSGGSTGGGSGGSTGGGSGGSSGGGSGFVKPGHGFGGTGHSYAPGMPRPTVPGYFVKVGLNRYIYYAPGRKPVYLHFPTPEVRKKV